VATSQTDIASQMKAALLSTMPELDTSVGTPAAKILDAVAASIANAYVDNQLLSYVYDIDSKTGADLDTFCQLFGIARLPAKRATGTVVFSRASGFTDTVFIAVSLQISSSQDVPVIVQTVTGATMNSGVTTVTVPVQAVNAGPTGNVGAGLLTNISSPVQGVSTVTNTTALSGGTDQETDSALRARWKATVFRNLAGTESMYLGIALDDADCFAANVVTATKNVREQVQIVSGTATSTVNDAKYVFGTPVTFGTDIDNGAVFVKDYDYTFTATEPPSVTVLNATDIPNGTVADLMYQYTPLASRNDPTSSIINRIDVWCAGNRPIAAQQALIFQSSLVFGSGSYPTTSYTRPDLTLPASGNVFIPLALGPIFTMSPTIVAGSTTYGLATPTHPLGTVSGSPSVTYAYQVVHDNTAFGWGPTSKFGLEWDAGHLPANGTAFTVGSDGAYTYNQVPQSVQQVIDSWRLAGTDARAHQAMQMPLRFSMAVMYDRNASPAQVNQSMDAALTGWLNSLGIDSVVQVSDAINVLHNVPGVDNVRFMNGSDYPGFTVGAANSYQVGIQLLNVYGAVTTSYVDTNGRAKDVIFTDSQIPVFGASVYNQRAQSSFGTY
jgi:hypothetical protein